MHSTLLLEVLGVHVCSPTKVLKLHGLKSMGGGILKLGGRLSFRKCVEEERNLNLKDYWGRGGGGWHTCTVLLWSVYWQTNSKCGWMLLLNETVWEISSHPLTVWHIANCHDKGNKMFLVDIVSFLRQTLPVPV